MNDFTHVKSVLSATSVLVDDVGVFIIGTLRCVAVVITFDESDELLQDNIEEFDARSLRSFISFLND